MEWIVWACPYERRDLKLTSRDIWAALAWFRDETKEEARAILVNPKNEHLVNGGIVDAIAHIHSPLVSLSGQELSNRKEVNMPRKLTSYEQETITNFNKAEDIAHIFTYEKTWQKHLEEKLGLKPVMDNGFGAREYELPKKMIKPPRAPRKLSDSAKKKLTERLHGNRVLSAQNLVPVGKSVAKNRNKGNSIFSGKKRQKIATLS